MAEPYQDTDPFADPQTAPDAGPGIMQQWSDALGDPKVRGALLSAGLSLMQPAGFGQTTAGKIGEAIGAAGATVGAQEKMDRDESESQSKQDLRAAQADSAMSRAQTAQANATTAEERLKNTQRDTESKIQLRAAQAATSLARVRQLEQRAMLLEAQVAAFPEDQEVKRQLIETKTRLAEEQINLTAARTETEAGKPERENRKLGFKEREVDIRQQDTDSKERLRTAREDALKDENGAVGVARERNRLSQIFQSQRRHRDAMGLYNKYVQSLPYGTTPPDSKTWMEKNGFGDVANGPMGGGAGAAATAPPAPPAAATPAPGSIEERAYNAIKAGAPSDAVRKRYKEQTGKDLP